MQNDTAVETFLASCDSVDPIIRKQVTNGISAGGQKIPVSLREALSMSEIRHEDNRKKVREIRELMKKCPTVKREHFEL